MILKLYENVKMENDLSLLIPVGVSNRHMHLTQESLDTLFGPNSKLTVYRDLYQRGEFASEQTVEMIGPKGSFGAVRILGPLRQKNQVEISKTDCFHLGINPPVGLFSKMPNGQSLTLKGPKGSLVIDENIMISRRHIHMNPDEAKEIGVKHQDVVFVAPLLDEKADPAQSRFCILGNVLVRVQDNFLLQMHIDLDEANAMGLTNNDKVYVVQSSIGKQAAEAPAKKLVTETDVRQALVNNQKIRLLKDTIVTPAARDLGNAKKIFIE